jgi:hypothetical protein
MPPRRKKPASSPPGTPNVQRAKAQKLASDAATTAANARLAAAEAEGAAAERQSVARVAEFEAQSKRDLVQLQLLQLRGAQPPTGVPAIPVVVTATVPSGGGPGGGAAAPQHLAGGSLLEKAVHALAESQALMIKSQAAQQESSQTTKTVDALAVGSSMPAAHQATAKEFLTSGFQLALGQTDAVRDLRNGILQSADDDARKAAFEVFEADFDGQLKKLFLDFAEFLFKTLSFTGGGSRKDKARAGTYCYQCGQPGHVSTHCPQNRRNGGPRERSRSPPRRKYEGSRR